MVNHLTTKNRLLVAMLAFILPFSFAKAEAKEDGKTISQGWYVGIEGGMPFGFSTFSSFGHDKTHLGWAAGLYGGYRFNSIFSAELSAKYGEVNMSAQDCCVERNYWLGSDGVLYKAGVLGMDSWEYANLKSHVRMGWYGARVNVHLLGLFHKTANSRWDLAVSPHIYAVTTKADIQTIADDAKVMKGSTNWHLGYGADLQVGYQLTSCLKLGIYSGLTRLTGERMDGMPEHLHKNNFVWESGIRLGISFAKAKKKNVAVETTPIKELEVPTTELEVPTTEPEVQQQVKDTAAWQERIKAWDEKNPLEMRRDRGMTPQMIMEHINHTFDEAVFVTDVGQNQMWATQYLDIDEKRQMITSGGLGTMGFGFPAAIGAKIGNRDTEVVCVTGDGGFQMNIQEMATAIVQGTPVIICLLNNQYLGMVRQMQQLFYGKRYSAVCLRKRRSCPANCKGPNEACPPYTPDFVALAESYGAHGIRVEREEDIQAALDKAPLRKLLF